jgi:Replicative DNA helicase
MQTILENPGVDIIPPQDLLAERYVLASLFFLPELIRSSNLTADLFYSTQNFEIFITLDGMLKENIPFDFPAISAELEKRKFDGVETMAQLDQLLTDSASGTDITYHVKALREKSRLRRLLNASYEIRQQIGMGARAEDVCTILDDVKKATKATDFTENVYIPTWDNCPADVQPLVELSNVRILSRGNIAMLTACAGAGKSSVLEAACSSILLPIGDTLGLSLNAKSLLYIDTERSRFDSNQSWQRALKRACIGPGAPIPAEWQWENIKPLEKLCDRLQYLWSRLDASNVPEIVLLDGIGDFIADPNDSDECTSLVYRLGAIADLRNIGVLVTLHNNPAMNSDKARGILGSELWRKCEAVMIINKLADGVRQLTTDYALGKNRSGSDKVASYFQWDTEKNMHVSCAAPSGPKGKTSCEREKILEYLGSKSTWSYNEMKTGIMDLLGKSEKTARNKMTDLIEMKKIVKNDTGTYSIGEKIESETPEYYHN